MFPFLDNTPIVWFGFLVEFLFVWLAGWFFWFFCCCFFNLAKEFERNAWKLRVLASLNAEVLIFRKACILYMGMLGLPLFKISYLVI